MKRELSPKEVLAVRCPTCGAAPKEKCELSTGQPRTDLHRDRRLIAADALSETARGRRQAHSPLAAITLSRLASYFEDFGLLRSSRKRLQQVYVYSRLSRFPVCT